ncbi:MULTISPECIES: endonuclease/exonuclease/phosphatase family protein [unclassified Caulobacter]|uniref:endonuclease/exonuclease/phosphatase family protein n=1 Tax=unclassified Caulobacter TaxID=2648921 RepID=UPI000D3780E1|nr:MULTISPECIES: endonuclease/exonuclease/phosphatase family protein [unclassified Caulobacter]PTS83237.1 endonuclease [Caulobacter sp. HMWF009]PTT12085.1 endonuclease [Caulobacter sp. HMWF025]
MTLRLMTYNVHRCVGTDRRLDIERVAEVIAAEAPDVVALQELDVGRLRTRREDQAHRLADLLKMSFHFHPAMTVEEELYGDAILTALPERRIRAEGLPLYRRIPGLEPRGALWVEVMLGDQPVQIINTHLGLVPQEQRRQAAALLGDRWMASDGWTAPGVLLGDFNAAPASATYRMLRAAMRDAQSPAGQGTGRSIATFPSSFPFMRIDHVFLTPGLSTLRVWSPRDARARLASDHLPLVVELELTAAGTPVPAAAGPSVAAGPA